MLDRLLSSIIKERDEVLLSMDLNKVIDFQIRHNPGYQIPALDAVEVGMHMARTACETLPMSERLFSKRWLVTRGYRSMDNGEVLDG